MLSPAHDNTSQTTSYSIEERIAQEHLLENNDDVVVVVLDASSLQRSLPLLQVMQTGANPVLCLNMADEARDAGQRLLLSKLQARLGFPVVETVASRKQGLDDLKKAIAHAIDHPYRPRGSTLTGPLQAAISAIEEQLDLTGRPPRGNTWAGSRPCSCCP